ncbi:hypothetical protein CDL15_Pgr028475 [Punica granatum]|nr:hypothetical protein CDL15_Pgr028475 [Punica granatum]PKI51207.1 hypothetical protein CRG98_028414 [Punica granatum]
MDLETENRIAAILMKEAAELRRQAEQEGVLSYLQQPTVRGRPNSRFLTATVLGVQQANKAVEVNEMWRVRQKELELDNRLKGRSRDDSRNGRIHHKDTVSTSRSVTKRLSVSDDAGGATCSSRTSVHEAIEANVDAGLKDEEVEEFLHSRVKRGRGSIGSRMDETGPFLPSREDAEEKISLNPDAWAQRVVHGPKRPLELKSYESSEEETSKDRQKKAKKDRSESSKKKHSHKHRSKEKSKDRKKEEKKSRGERKKKDGKRRRE